MNDEYTVWAPHARHVDVRIDGETHRMTRGEAGHHLLPGLAARPGARYAFRLDDGEQWLPDPRSMHQPDGVHADSAVVEASRLQRDPDWSGRDLRGAVLYELHTGTFTPGADGRGGTFDSAIERLDDLVRLGVDAVEVMPVAAFPGERGWGYDGVSLFAVHQAYGGPEAFARFITAAHRRGLAVVLDVVYNHLGPAGNYMARFGPYFTAHHHTPWGHAVNLDDEGAEEVRAFLLANARQWLLDYQVDGLRLDAVHELRDDSGRHLLAELADAVAGFSREAGRPLTLIAESDRNDPRTVTPTPHGGLGMGMQWADDVHHAASAWITGERDGYYVDFGSSQTLAKTLTRIFEHDGSHSTFRGQAWGAPVDPGSTHYDGHSFVAFLQNHDQVGNRAAGDRIHHGISPGAHAAAITPILLGATTPMLFQGEEWAASTPFTYFTDHDPELGRLVSAGRAEEFARMGWEGQVPDPQARETFERSILRWEEADAGDHGLIGAWYRTLIRLRRTEPELRDGDVERTVCDVLGEDTVLLHRGGIDVLVHRGDVPPPGLDPGTEVLASSWQILARDATPSGPGAVVFRPGDR